MLTLEDALTVLEEIATGDQEREAFKKVAHDVEVYRTMYEGAEKRLMRYRDVAARPDIAVPTENKDMVSDYQTAVNEYERRDKERYGGLTLAEWLFQPVDRRNSSKEETV